MDNETRRLYEMKADVMKALAHPLRLAVLDFLKDGEQCVCDIAAYVGSERSNVSRHLAIMVKASLLDHRKQGLSVYYRVRRPCALRFLSCVENVLREQAAATSALVCRL